MRHEGLPADFLADSVTAIGLANHGGFHSYNLANPDAEGAASLDDFVDWMIAAGCAIERIAPYDEWLWRFETAMNALPEGARQQSLLAILDPWRKPQAAVAESFVPAARFKAGAEAAGHPIPSLSAALIGKYVADLRGLGLLA